MSVSLEQLNLEEGKSEVLRGVFACLEQATATDGSPRYPSKACLAVARAVVCRTYGKLILELVHLVAAASARGQRFEHVFWGVDRAAGGAFRGVFTDLAKGADTFRLHGNGVIVENGADGFHISFGRMPLLAAMLEFLVTALGYELLDETTQAFRDGRTDADTMSDVAGQWQRALYAYLKDHLPPMQRQRRERHFLSFAMERAGNRTSLDAIDDAAVLDYWSTFSGDGPVEAKTYRGVYETARRLVMVLEAAASRQMAGYARTIGSDREAGEVDPDTLAEAAELLSNEGSTLSRLNDACGTQVKIVNASEADILADIPDSPGVARRLPVSVLRNGVFGGRQLQITNASRRGADMTSLLDAPNDGFYRDRLSLYEDTLGTLERVAMAALWALFDAGHEASCDLALALAPDLNWGSLAERGEDDPDADGTVVHFAEREALRRFMNETPDIKGDEVQALLAEARRAHRAINRLGFKGEVDTDVIDAMAEAVPAILALMTNVRRYLASERGARDWSRLETEDGQVFANVFAALYNGQEAHSHVG